MWAKGCENLAMWNAIAHFNHALQKYKKWLLNIFLKPFRENELHTCASVLT
jgi:hypothetical protein